ncbi:MAG: hypothetical protein E6Q97_01150 [Desulfurellales bacterium]|nr:MAG: hypothetical protein E6Q97_01150 [Desulfurellales bacterium]
MIGTYHFRPCPHCGELMRSGTLARHEPVCIKRPDIYARLRSVLIADDGTCGITYKHYAELSAADKSLPSLNTLIRRTKSTHWAGVLAFFKLSSPPQDVYCEPRITQPQPERRKPKERKPQPKPKPAEPPSIAYAIADPEVHAVILPLPRIAPRDTARAVNKWAGVKGYDPTWKAPTGDTQWLVMVQPGERTCLGCGDTFAAGGYCIRCGVRDDGAWCSEQDRPPSVPTVSYLNQDEYMVQR